MRAEVLFDGAPVGELLWEPDAFGVQISLDCAIPCNPLILLRCYGQTSGKPFLIGLPEPQRGRLRLSRHLSRETLKQAGCLETPPTVFYLSDGSTPPPKKKLIMETSAEKPETKKEEKPDKSPGPVKPPEPVKPPKPPEPSESPESPEPPSDEPPASPVPHTGDALLDRLFLESDVQGKTDGTLLELSCPFIPDRPFALAPVFALCTIRDGEATFRWNIQQTETEIR